MKFMCIAINIFYCYIEKPDFQPFIIPSLVFLKFMVFLSYSNDLSNKMFGEYC